MKKLGYQSLAIITFTFLLLIVAPSAKPFESVHAKGLELLASLTPGASPESIMEPKVREALALMDEGDMITVIVTMRSQADFSSVQAGNRQERISRVIRILQNEANATQLHIRALLELKKKAGEVADYDSFWVFNGLVVTAKASVIEELANRPEIATIAPNEVDVIEAIQSTVADPEPNLSVVNAPALWDMGYRGQGIVVANMDSGVDYTHPDLFSRWRGGSNSWFDPYGQHPDSPTDLSGHGTWTMGAMVGGDSSGTVIGLAPEAKWIAAKIFDDSGTATAAAIHASFQWILDPDNNPDTPDTPHVVNNSWNIGSGGCDLQFELDLQALRAAGVLPVFAAGNAGPYAESSRSPANNPSAFAVGATTNTDVIYFQSSRGPSSCGESATFFPEVVTPGVDIKTADLYGLYYNATGTSMAAPHVAGALALLLSANPDLSAADQEAALLSGAVDLGSAGPDNDYGYGRLDVLASYQWLQGGGTATPTPTPAENLALGKPVTVSSFQDESHNGDQAVDGGAASYWQTKRVRGKNGPASESLTVDLGSLSTVDDILVSWHDYYATSYEIELSENGSDWSSVYATSSSDGGLDTLTVGGAAARYVRMTSTAWSDNSLRNWVREVEIWGSPGSLTPTATPTPTDTPTATPTPAPTSTSTSLAPTTAHIGDLDGSARSVGRSWKASVTITVHDGYEAPLANAAVSGSWSGGSAGTASCVTDALGQCSLTTGKIDGQQANVTLSVDDLFSDGYLYEPANNHDLDGDSNGRAITVSKP